MRLRIVKTVFLKELREMLRDRRSLAIMFGIPLLVYPLLTVGLTSLGSARKQELQEQRQPIAVLNAEAAPRLLEELQAEGSGLLVTKPTADNPDQALRGGAITAIVEVPSDAQIRALAAEEVDFVVRVDESRSATPFIQRKIDEAIGRYEQWIIEQRLSEVGAAPSLLRKLTITTEDIASGEARLGLRLAQLLPVLLLVTGMLGALFPALNATTQERELGTLETLLVSPATRVELLIAKGTLVFLSGLLTAGLNMASMSLVLWRVFASMDQGATNLQISLGALALSFLAAVPALIFFTTIVLIVGLIARNFREANAFATPVMLLPLAAVALSIMEPETTPGLLITPVANTTLIIRDVLTGRGSFAAFGLAFSSSCVYAGLMLSVAARLFSNEQLVNPAWEPLSLRGLRFGGRGGRTQRPRRVPAVDEAFALFAVVLLLFFYISPSLQPLGLVPMLFINQVVIFGMITILFAWFGRYDVVQTFSFRRPAALEILAAVLVAIGISPFVSLFTGFQVRVWPPDLDKQEMMAELFLPWLRNYPVFIAVYVALLAGIFEELLFRGPIQASMVRRLPPWIAIAAAGLLFAAIHFDLHGLPLRWMLGALLGWVVWRSGSIVVAMVLHATYDFTRLIHAAIELKARGEEAITSSELPALFTMASVIELAVGGVLLTIGFVLFARLWRQRKQSVPPEPALATAVASAR